MKLRPTVFFQHPFPADPLSARFFHYFHHTWDYILKPQGGQWRTYSEYPLKPRTLWRCYKSDRTTIGLRFASQTWYGLIDLDVGSSYHPSHNAAAYQRILKTLRKLGIERTLTITSSNSGGLHIYFFLPAAVHSYSLAAGMKKVFTKAKLDIRPGQLEIFPNTKRYTTNGNISLYNGHRLPLQQGSYLLDENLQPVTNDLQDFLDAADWCAAGQNIRKLKRTIKSAYEWYKNTPEVYDYSPEGGIAWRADLEYRIAEGWTGRGQTNELLKDLANYGWVFGGTRTFDELSQFIHRRAIALPGYQQWCRHQNQILQRCRDWAKSALRYWSPYPSLPTRSISYEQLYDHHIGDNADHCAPSPPENARAVCTCTCPSSSRRTRRQLNQERRQDSLHRLKAVIAHLEELKTLPQTITERIHAICRTAQELFGRAFSLKTLRKELYLPLWHPKHREEAPVVEPTPAIAESAQNQSPELAIAQDTMTNKRQPETFQQEECGDRSHESIVTSSTDQKPVLLKPLPLKDFSKKDPTIMKCFEGAQPDLHQSAMKTILNNAPSSKTSFSELFLTSTQKLARNAGMVGKVYRYTGERTSGPVYYGQNQRYPKLVSLCKSAVVEVLDAYHSSSMHDGVNPLLVYVRPLYGADKWQSGIAIPAFSLTFIDSQKLRDLRRLAELVSLLREL